MWLRRHKKHHQPRHDFRPNKQIKVFLVEDSALVRERIAEQLSDIPEVNIVGQAEDPSGAIAAIAATEPDVVLLDIGLRGGSGMQVLRHVNRDLPEVKVIMLSNHSGPEYREHFKNAGAYSFFDKAEEFDKVSDVLIDLAIGRYINSIAR